MTSHGLTPPMLNPNLTNPALGGAVVDPTRFDPSRLDVRFGRPASVDTRSDSRLYDDIHPSDGSWRNGPRKDQRSFQASARYTVGIVIVSALIFISLIAMFDILRNLLYTVWPEPASAEPRAVSARLLVISAVFGLASVVIAVAGTCVILLSLKRVAASAFS